MHRDSALAPDYVWTNKDMDPVPLRDQTWTLWTWMAYWATDTINLGTWETASSIIAVGLTWKDAIPIMIVGTFCVAVPVRERQRSRTEGIEADHPLFLA